MSPDFFVTYLPDRSQAQASQTHRCSPGIAPIQAHLTVSLPCFGRSCVSELRFLAVGCRIEANGKTLPDRIATFMSLPVFVRDPAKQEKRTCIVHL